MGSLYLSSIMKVQTTISFFLVALCLCVSHISAKNIPGINDVELEKSESDAVLKRKARGWFSREEEENDSDDDYYEDNNDDDYGDYGGDRNGNSNGRGNGNGRGNDSGRGNNDGRFKNVDWYNVILGIIGVIRSAGIF